MSERTKTCWFCYCLIDADFIRDHLAAMHPRPDEDD